MALAPQKLRNYAIWFFHVSLFYHQPLSLYVVSLYQRQSWPVHPYMGRAMTLDYADGPNFNIYHGFRLSS
jgi:hypothetical protein